MRAVGRELRRPGRGRRRARPRRRPAARQGRGRLRRPGEAVDPGRRHGGGDRRRLPRRRLGRGRRARHAAARRAHRRGGRRPRRPGLQDPAAGAGGPALRPAAPLRGRATRAPTTPSGSSPRSRSSASTPRARARADRRSRPSRPRPAGLARRLQPPSRQRGRGRRARVPELPEVETIRRDLEKEVVGKKIKTVEVTGHAHRSAATRTASSSSIAPRGPQDHRRRPARASTCCVKLDSDDVLVVHLGMSGQLLRRQAPEGPMRQAHPRRASPSPRAASCASSTPARSASCSSPRPTSCSRRRCPSSPTSASTRSRTSMSWGALRRAAARRGRRS